jgi:kynureninase
VDLVKYLCGGAGAAFLYVRKDLIESLHPRVTRWFANESPFAFTMPEQTYTDSIWRFIGGAPAVVALYQARAGHEIIGEIGVTRIRENSLRQTQRIMDIVDERGYTLASPRQADIRGGSVVMSAPPTSPASSTAANSSATIAPTPSFASRRTSIRRTTRSRPSSPRSTRSAASSSSCLA